MRVVVFIYLLLIVTGCSLEHQYSNALKYASIYEPPERGKLFSLSPENDKLVKKIINGEEYILTVAWKENTSYYKNDPTGFYNTDSYPVFITLATELELWGSKNVNAISDTLRVKQLLGLPPNSVKNGFVEFWVRPEDIYRPCRDSSIFSSSCPLAFPEYASAEYRNWFITFYTSSYNKPEPYENYPFTGMGFTFDWNRWNTSHTGMSEYIISEYKNIQVNGIFTFEEYFDLKTKK